jgi:pimeloyl-ACP methyl ester carboxylesterase
LKQIASGEGNKSMHSSRRPHQIVFAALAVTIFATGGVPASGAGSEKPLTAWQDPSPHAIKFVTVEEKVQLEVLDWGGSGQPVILLAGGGNTAHVFDEFAPRLAANSHVYGITRRGFGASGFSASATPVDRLRDDVLAVIDALKLRRPVLVGHSIAGAELSAVATSSPDRVAGLVYIEAGYPYAFDNGHGPTMKQFQEIGGGPRGGPRKSDSDLATFPSLQQWEADTSGFRKPQAEFRQTWDSDSNGRPQRPRDFPGSQLFMTILTSTNKFKHIPTPSLVLFAIPHVQARWIDTSTDSAVKEAAKTYYTKLDSLTAWQARTFETGVPTARVVGVAGAHHLFLSNEGDVLREMRDFLVSLK